MREAFEDIIGTEALDIVRVMATVGAHATVDREDVWRMRFAAAVLEFKTRVVSVKFDRVRLDVVRTMNS